MSAARRLFCICLRNSFSTTGVTSIFAMVISQRSRNRVGRMRNSGLKVQSGPHLQADLHADHCLSWWFIDAAAGFQVDRTKQVFVRPDPVTDMRLNQ